MLLEIQSRGMDATGIAYPAPDGKFQIHKIDQPAALFVRQRLCVPKRQTTAIMHTRFATQGHESFNGNNHPIPAGTVVGVHNGMISNDWSLFMDIKKVVGRPVRQADVDSEAIFALLGYIDQPVTKSLEEIRGSAAIAWYDRAKGSDPEVLHLARLNGSPLIICETEGGSLLFASTKAAILKGLEAGHLMPKKIREVEEGVYLTVLDGEIRTVQTFQPARSYVYNSRQLTRYTPAWDESDYDFETWNGTLDSRTYTGRGRTVTALRADLEAELAEAGGNEADDDERLEQWLEENASSHTETEALKDKDEQAIRMRFAKAPYINSGHFDVEHVIEPMSESQYLACENHVERENAIEKWCNGIQGSAEAVTRSATHLKASARPGDAVRCDVAGTSLIGHVVRLPETFPHGEYVLRLFSPNKKRKHGFESVLVSKPYHEFQTVEERKAMSA
jgi:hypothetical protein